MSFENANEYDQLRAAEDVQLGGNGWLLYWPTLGIGKWSMTGELFDRRELRAALRGRLRERLLHDPGLLPELSAELRATAIEILGSRGVRPEPATVDRNLLLLHLADPEPGLAPFVDGDGTQSIRVLGHFGELGRFVVAVIDGSTGREGVYDLALDSGPQLLVATPTDTRHHIENETRSLIANEALIAAGVAVTTTISLTTTFPPIPIIALFANTATSLLPSVPFKSVDALAGSRGALLGYLESGNANLPLVLQPARNELKASLNTQLAEQNRYWPRAIQEQRLVEHNWSWLAERRVSPGERAHSRSVGTPVDHSTPMCTEATTAAPAENLRRDGSSPIVSR